MVSFDVTKEEHKKLNAIANRAVSMAAEFNLAYGKRDALMDLTACHANGMPLDLDKFAVAPDPDFAHDVFGIRRHINRSTGVIEDCFVPRCAQRGAGRGPTA